MGGGLVMLVLHVQVKLLGGNHASWFSISIFLGGNGKNDRERSRVSITFETTLHNMKLHKIISLHKIKYEIRRFIIFYVGSPSHFPFLQPFLQPFPSFSGISSSFKK